MVWHQVFFALFYRGVTPEDVGNERKGSTGRGHGLQRLSGKLKAQDSGLLWFDMVYQTQISTVKSHTEQRSNHFDISPYTRGHFPFSPQEIGGHTTALVEKENQTLA